MKELELLKEELAALKKGIENIIGLVVVKMAKGFEAVMKTGQNCKHQGTTLTKDCFYALGGICPKCDKWELDTFVCIDLVEDVTASICDARRTKAGIASKNPKFKHKMSEAALKACAACKKKS
jgi:hypothetical protein